MRYPGARTMQHRQRDITVAASTRQEATEMTVPALTLYHYWRSSSSWRVRWALAEKQLAHASVSVNLLAGEQGDPAFREKSPAGFVPALVVGDRVLTESVAICEYLDDIAPERPLRPADPFSRAQMRQLVELVNAGTQPLQNLYVLRKMGDKPAQDAWARQAIERGLGAFEAALATSRAQGSGAGSGPFCVGPSITLADIFLAPQLYNARRFQVDLAPFPLCTTAERAALETDAGRASHPDAWAPAPHA
jgi:maleylacetoacetate isomerase